MLLGFNGFSSSFAVLTDGSEAVAKWGDCFRRRHGRGCTGSDYWAKMIECPVLGRFSLFDIGDRILADVDSGEPGLVFGYRDSRPVTHASMGPHVRGAVARSGCLRIATEIEE